MIPRDSLILLSSSVTQPALTIACRNRRCTDCVVPRILQESLCVAFAATHESSAASAPASDEDGAGCTLDDWSPSDLYPASALRCEDATATVGGRLTASQAEAAADGLASHPVE